MGLYHTIPTSYYSLDGLLCRILFYVKRCGRTLGSSKNVGAVGPTLWIGGRGCPSEGPRRSTPRVLITRNLVVLVQTVWGKIGYSKIRCDCSDVASIGATEAVASVVFHSSCLENLNIIPANSKNNNKKNKLQEHNKNSYFTRTI